LVTHDVVRVPRALAARLSNLAEVAQRRTSLTIPYSVVVRSVLERGLDELELELGIRRAPRSKATDSADDPKGDSE
jgi:predicted DNA-binding protein